MNNPEKRKQELIRVGLLISMYISALSHQGEICGVFIGLWLAIYLRKFYD